MEMNEIIEMCADNSYHYKDYAKNGIFQYAKRFFPDRVTNNFDYVHYEIIAMFFQTLDPRHEYSFEKMRYILIHREAAKSTILTFFVPTFCIYMKGYSIYVRKSMLDW